MSGRVVTSRRCLATFGLSGTEGKSSIGMVRLDQADLYYFSMSDCNACPRKAKCLTPGEREGQGPTEATRILVGRSQGEGVRG